MKVLRSCAIAACVLMLAGPGIAGQRGQGGNPQGQGPQGRGQGQGGRQGGFGMPPRDTRAQPTGTARIRGRVQAADTGNPLRRAQLRVSSAELRVSRMVSTDNDGRYDLKDLPAGRYTLSVSKGGFVSLQYGQRRPFEPGKPLEISEGQTLDKIDFNLPRGSVIAGHITDEFGEPVSDAMVQAMRYQFVNGQRRLTPSARPMTTDDIGQFRIFGLSPGDYFVSASLRNPQLGPQLGPGPGPDASEDTSGYAPTYYPGAINMAEAQRVTVSLGQEQSSINFSLIPARMSRISGSVSDSQGKPLAGGIVAIRPNTGDGMFVMSFGGGGSGQIRPDGSFTLANVAPGDYVLEVRPRPRDMMAGETDVESASVPITIAGEDVAGMSIVTTKGATVAGSVVFQGKTPLPTSRGQMQVVAASTSPDAMPFGRFFGDGRVNDDGTFELRGLSGARVIRLANAPSGWALKSITLNGTNITDEPYEFKGGGTISGLEVVLTDKLTDLSGTVKDSRGQVVQDYVAVVFSEDSKEWGFQTRFIKTGRPDQQGHFKIKGLPPEHYLAVAVESLEQGSESDPDFLDQLRQSAKSFSLSEGQTLSIDLGMSTTP